jgi:fermentation-respiration switch protein FrsA (DUF1100 family)
VARVSEDRLSKVTAAIAEREHLLRVRTLLASDIANEDKRVQQLAVELQYERNDVARLTTGVMAQFLEYDPLPTARMVRRTPVLIVQGATDLQVTADQAPELEAAFKAAGNRDVTMRVFPEANHLLIQDPIGDPARYTRLPDRSIRTDILGAILDWLQAKLR